MLKCPVCGKQKTLLEMRPLINVKELAMGNELSEQDGEREVGGAKLQMVCRNCWSAILETKEKEEVIEILETLSALLIEIDRRNREQAHLPSLVGQIVEKDIQLPSCAPEPPPFIPSRPNWPGIRRFAPDPNSASGIGDPIQPHTGTPSWIVGHGSTLRMDWSVIQSLGDAWDGAVASINQP